VDEFGDPAQTYEWDSMQRNNILASLANRFLILKREPDPESVAQFREFIRPKIKSFLADVRVQPITTNDFLDVHVAWPEKKKTKYALSFLTQKK